MRNFPLPDGAEWTYVLPDALGSVRQEADATGTVTAVREWSPYGVEVGSTQGGLGYTGEWFDVGVGLVYLRARWYDGGAGRFTQVDPWSGDVAFPSTLNHFVYVVSNPINNVDPSGLRCCLFRWDSPTPVFFSKTQPYLSYEAWIKIASGGLDEIPLPVPIDIEFELPEHPAIRDLMNVGLEYWGRHISRLQDGESWQTKTCIVLDGTKLSLQYQKITLVDAQVTIALAVWRQELIIANTIGDRHFGLYRRSVPQSGFWRSSKRLDWDYQSNGLWPYNNIEWNSYEWH